MLLHVCVWCFYFIPLHLLIALITDFPSASHSVLRKKQTLRAHETKKEHKCLSLVSHTSGSSSQSGGGFDSLPAGDPPFIVSSPWSLVPLFSSAGAERLSPCLCVWLCLTLTEGGKNTLEPGIHLDSCLLLSSCGCPTIWRIMQIYEWQ